MPHPDDWLGVPDVLHTLPVRRHVCERFPRPPSYRNRTGRPSIAWRADATRYPVDLWVGCLNHHSHRGERRRLAIPRWRRPASSQGWRPRRRMAHMLLPLGCSSSRLDASLVQRLHPGSMRDADVRVCARLSAGAGSLLCAARPVWNATRCSGRRARSGIAQSGRRHAQPRSSARSNSM